MGTSPHVYIVMLPAPLLVLAVILELVALRGSAGLRSWARGLVTAALGLVLLAGFTGLGARRRLVSVLPGDGTPWDGHALWAVVLAVPLLALGIVRLRRPAPRTRKEGWFLVLLDVAMALLASTIMYTGLHPPAP